MNGKEKKKRFFFVISSLIFFSILPSYLIFQLIQNKKDQNALLNYGTLTECTVVAYTEGKSGIRGPKKGFYNKCQYNINDSLHYCYIFTSKKPLPSGSKISLKYYQKRNKSVIIDFPDTKKYNEYGFNDYGY